MFGVPLNYSNLPLFTFADNEKGKNVFNSFATDFSKSYINNFTFILNHNLPVLLYQG